MDLNNISTTKYCSNDNNVGGTVVNLENNFLTSNGSSNNNNNMIVGIVNSNTQNISCGVVVGGGGGGNSDDLNIEKNNSSTTTRNMIGSDNSEIYSSVNTIRSKVSPSGSNNSSNTSFCRICHEGENIEILVAPCHCTGTVALIHRTCLERWLTSSNSDKCEICKHQYITTREPRSCVEYVQDTSNQFNVRNLIADIVCFFLLTPLLIVSTYLCIIGANQYFMRERWEAIGLIVLSLFLMAVYLTWCHVTIKFHLSVWLTWQRTNQRVRLIEIINCRNGNFNTLEQQEPIGVIGSRNHCTVEISPILSNININTPIMNLNVVGRIIQESDEESIENECDTSRIIVS